MRGIADARGEGIVQRFDAIQNMSVTLLLFCIDAFAEKFRAIFTQHDAFDFRAAEIDADAKHILSCDENRNCQACLYISFPRGNFSRFVRVFWPNVTVKKSM